MADENENAEISSTVEAPFGYLLPDRQPDYPHAVEVDDSQDVLPNFTPEKEEPAEPSPPNMPVSPSKPPSHQPDQSKSKTGKGIGDGRGGVKRAGREDCTFHVSSCPPPILSEKAIDSRIRRVFKPRADGSTLLDDTWQQQWANKESRVKLLEMFEKVGYNVDRGAKNDVELVVILFVLKFILKYSGLFWGYIPQRSTQHPQYMPKIRKLERKALKVKALKHTSHWIFTVGTPNKKSPKGERLYIISIQQWDRKCIVKIFHSST